MCTFGVSLSAFESWLILPKVLQTAAVSRIRHLGAVPILVRPHSESGQPALHRTASLPVALLPAPVHVHQHELGHPKTRGPERQAYWHPRVPEYVVVSSYLW